MRKLSDTDFRFPEQKILQDEFKLPIPKYCRDEAWSDSFRYRQDALEQWRSAPGESKTLTLDFRKCRWIDPLPLLAISVEAIRCLRCGARVVAVLPKPQDESRAPTDSPYGESPNRLVRFLKKEGWLASLRQYGVALKIGDTSTVNSIAELTIEVENNLDAIPTAPSYLDATCIPFCILDVPVNDEGYVAKEVTAMLGGVERGLRSRISPPNRRRLMYKLRLATQELLHNIQDHAYGDGDPIRLAGVYARYRVGGQRQDRMGAESYRTHISAEHDSCPRLLKFWLDDRPACIELFVVDRGIGFTGSLKRPVAGNEGDNPLKRLMQSVFLHGQSRKKRTTEHGGLYLLYRLLAADGDYVRVLDDGMWYGSAAPGFREEEQVTIPTKNQSRFHGLALQFRLGWRETGVLTKAWLNHDNSLSDQILDELCRSELPTETGPYGQLNQFRVIDERFLDSTWNDDGNPPTASVLWLPQPHRMKWDILLFLRTQIAAISLNDINVLVIADIPDHEAVTFEAALANTSFAANEQWPRKIRRILLATSRWHFMTLNWVQQEDGRHGFVGADHDQPTRRQSDAMWVVRLLKWHDSRRFWAEIDADRAPLLYIPEQVVWSKNADNTKNYISGYLDFPQASRVRLCAEIYKCNLARLFGIFPEKTIALVPIDRLTREVVQEVYSTEAQDIPESGTLTQKVAIGSVLVSGTTLHSSGLQSRAVHFFVHPDSPLIGGHPSLLFWFGRRDVRTPPNNANEELARIGRTAAIGRGGWKSIEIPRFNQESHSIAARNPSQTYEDLQCCGPVVLKFGHWTYEGHHDFLTINFSDAVQEAFFRKDSLADFLVGAIFPFIGLTQEDCTSEWAKQHCRKPEALPKHGILVYRSHPSSERIVDELIRLANARGREKILARTFALLPIRARWGGSSFLVPPLVREQIQNALANAEASGQALVMDDAAISGRTISDLHASLISQGAKSIQTLVIGNRVRSPAGSFGKEDLRHYWRVDLPVMGREGNCPMCHALDLLSAFSKKLVADSAKEDIVEWRSIWAKVSPMERWDAGLDPLRLIEAKTKDFCYRPDVEKYLARIALTHSTGLAMHAAEVHAMTGRDDYVLKVIDQNPVPEICIELAASHLFLYGDELDHEICRDLLRRLFSALAQLKGDTTYSSLAALAIIATLSWLDKEGQRLAASIVKELDWNRYDNYAATVLLSYLISEEILAQEEKFRNASRLLSVSGMAVGGKLRQMFRETRSARGYAHSEPLSSLMEKLRLKERVTGTEIRNASDSCNRIVHIVDQLGSDLAEMGSAVKENGIGQYQELVAELNTVVTTCRVVLDRISGQKGAEGIVDDLLRIPAKGRIDAVLKALLRVADHYFFRTTPDLLDTDHSFENKIIKNMVEKEIPWKEILGMKNLSGDVRDVALSNFSRVEHRPSDLIEIWIVWHRHIKNLVKDLLMNAVWATTKIPDPWRATSGHLAHMWYSVVYEQQAAILMLVNKLSPDMSAQAAFEKAKEGCQQKNSWHELEAVGGSVQLPKPEWQITTDATIYQVCISIPYAPYLRDS